MPVFINRSPFQEPQKRPKASPAPKPARRPTGGLRAPQARVLAALMPARPDAPRIDWPMFTRAGLRVRCGLAPTNSMNRILHGIKDGPSKHPGLIQLGLIEEEMLDIDGVAEANYRITRKGVELCLSLQAGADPK